MRLPGVDLPENATHQFDEIGAMTDEDFDVLEKDGVFALFSSLIPRIYPEMTIEQALMDIDRAGNEITEQGSRLREKGIEPAVGFIIPGPAFDYFCFARSVNKALLDLRKRPAKMKSAGKRYCEDMLGLAVPSAMQCSIKRVFIGLSRSSPVFLSSKYFEEFILPDLDFLIHGLIDAGITPVLHCDTNWTKFLPYFRRFPRARCILELDSFTDIFRAKEILGDHTAIMGDVPSTLLAEGSRDDVRDYCRRLIDEVGAGGGFILSSGCSIPLNARQENVLAMTEAVEEWGWYS
jgi:uroporphyrinogen-III decarboxylase